MDKSSIEYGTRWHYERELKGNPQAQEELVESDIEGAFRIFTLFRDFDGMERLMNACFRRGLALLVDVDNWFGSQKRNHQRGKPGRVYKSKLRFSLYDPIELEPLPIRGEGPPYVLVKRSGKESPMEGANFVAPAYLTR